jgi:RNA methyltransferase, TrmH family
VPARHPYSLEPAGYGHPLVQEFVNIKRNRRPDDQFSVALEGLWAIRAAMAAPISIRAVFVCPAVIRGDEIESVLAQVRGDVARLEVSERVLRRLSERDGPDGLVAIAQLSRTGPSDLVPGTTARIAVADNLELPGNLGTVIRCADGAGAAGVIVSDGRLRLTNPALIKASMGTLFSVPILKMGHAEAFQWLRALEFRVIVAHPFAKLSYREVDYSGRVALVVGSERNGLTTFWRRAADVQVSIPMLGMADSLNVGNAAALLLYEALYRQG